MSTNEVILVTEKDEAIGVMEKMEAHRRGVLHRAFSVFLFDQEGHMLLQQRSAHKYHGALLWSNTCCSHPYPGEAVEKAAVRRLQEELGFTAPLEKIFTFMDRIHEQVNENPDSFTSWFRIAFPLVEKWWQQREGERVKKIV